MRVAKHLKIAFDAFEYGIIKRRLLEGEPEDCDDWTIGHPLLFPNILAVSGTVDGASLQFRVPVDDTHTRQFAYRTLPRKPGEPPQPIAAVRSSQYDANGKLVTTTIPSQDMIGWTMQGAISDRTREHLAGSDVGVIMFRKMLTEQMERVKRGEEPAVGIVRDAARNEPWIALHREQTGMTAFGVTYDNYFEQIKTLAATRH